MSYWNHRVLRQTHVVEPLPPEVVFSIHEVHYDDDGTVKGHTAEPVGLQADNVRELAEEWMRMRLAFDKPVLEYVDGTYRELEDFE